MGEVLTDHVVLEQNQKDHIVLELARDQVAGNVPAARNDHVAERERGREVGDRLVVGVVIH